MGASLSARRAWIEIPLLNTQKRHLPQVALRKESVDRNSKNPMISVNKVPVALRKESVDRNSKNPMISVNKVPSLSARRAWIEIPAGCWRDARRAVALRKESVDRNFHLLFKNHFFFVALRKESVDRNTSIDNLTQGVFKSLSARRAWIEIGLNFARKIRCVGRSPQGERG